MRQHWNRCPHCGCRDCDRGASKCPNCGELIELRDGETTAISPEEWRRMRRLDINPKPKAVLE